MKLHAKDKGSMGELLVAADLISKGYSVFAEHGDNSKIDLIAVDNKYNLYKVQVKSVNSKKSVAKVDTKKSGPNYKFSYESHHFDVCAIYVIDYSKILYVSSKEFLENKALFSIRMDPSKNNQKVRTHSFEDYLSFEKAINGTVT